MFYIIRNDFGDSNDNSVTDYIVEAESPEEAIALIGDDAVETAVKNGIPKDDLIIGGDELHYNILYFLPRPEEFEDYEAYGDNAEHNAFSLESETVFSSFDEAYAYAKAHFYFHGIYSF